MSLTLSVVVCTLDREGPLRQALLGLDRLTGPTIEVVVVNGPSVDGTARLLGAYAGRIKTASCPEPNLSKARNIGLALCAGDVVALLDDDAVPHPFWARRLLARFSDPRMGGVGGYTVGRNGEHFQSRKIVCDRYGDSHMMTELFNEQPLNQPGSFMYPAPMGTNVAFRRAALEEVGGFDETFAYFLDETDVCLRLVDAGWRVGFEPSALVWHQFDASHLRDGRSIPRELRTLAMSKSYFVQRHGRGDGSPDDRAEAFANLAAFRSDKLAYLGRLARDGAITDAEASRLGRELDDGLAKGEAASAIRLGRRSGDWRPGLAPPLHPFGGGSHLQIGFVCRSFPPRSEAGIARWTRLAADGLAERGHTVHIVAESAGSTGVSFRDGVWLHQIEPASEGYGDVCERTGAPTHAARWAAAVRMHLPVLAAFGLDVLSFPIWDAEGVACIGQTDIPLAVSLHTTSALSGSHFRAAARGTDPARAEKVALEGTTLVLANSRAALADIARTSEVELASRALIVPHGTSVHERAEIGRGTRLKVLFVGRNEPRKGPDIALSAVAAALQAGADVEATFVGAGCAELAAAAFRRTPALAGQFVARGFVDRAELEELYRSHDLLLTPSRYESFGLVAIEAMAHGLPVLATAVGGLVEVVSDGLDGYLVRLNDGTSDRLGELIADLCRDRVRLSALGAAAHETARTRFSVETMSVGLEAAFRRLARRELELAQ